MNKGLSFGLNLKKKPSKPARAARKPGFGDDHESDEDSRQTDETGAKVETITELDGFEVETTTRPDPEPAPEKKKKKATKKPPGSGADDDSDNDAGALKPPSKKSSAPALQLDNLSESLSSRKHAEAAEALDATIYDYDAVYDSFKPTKKAGDQEKEGAERRPRYMNHLMAAASVRERDRLIAEEKRLAREREAEGDEFADKEKFVTEAYKRQREENRRIEEEEKRREEEEAAKNKNKGMTGFYKNMLEQQDREHAEKMKAAEEARKKAETERQNGQEDTRRGKEDGEEEKTEAELAKEIIDKGGKITINEDGQLVDKRQLLSGGLNVGAKKKAEAQRERARQAAASSSRGAERGGVYGGGGRQGVRERQSRMLEAQLEENLKRAREEEEEERKKVELASKSRKTESEISSAKERYLARKRAAEEAKKRGEAEEP